MNGRTQRFHFQPQDLVASQGKVAGRGQIISRGWNGRCYPANPIPVGSISHSEAQAVEEGAPEGHRFSLKLTCSQQFSLFLRVRGMSEHDILNDINTLSVLFFSICDQLLCQ